MSNPIDDASEVGTLFGLALLVVVQVLAWFHTKEDRRWRPPWLARKKEPSPTIDASQLTTDEIVAETARIRALNALRWEEETAAWHAAVRRSRVRYEIWEENEKWIPLIAGGIVGFGVVAITLILGKLLRH